MSANFNAVIFDLDGTLVDSASGILASFAAAFSALNLQPARPLTPNVIGPPLAQTLQNLAGNLPPEDITQLASAFKEHYDTIGCLQALPYPGVEGLLSTISKAKVPLILATNKRSIPTRKILAHLGWRKYFADPYSLDSLDPPAGSKGHLLEHIVSGLRLTRSASLYVGDRHDDAEAASFAKIKFFHASWGYEINAQSSTYETSGDLDTLNAFLGIPA